MHGRLKVRTTAEQAEAKRIEREKKLKVYQSVTSKITSKRERHDLDDEALGLTKQILLSNPDFYTFWNYRREILEHLKNVKETEQLQDLCINELSFLESCLPVNPKSYGIWHHRSWVMLFMPKPDWTKELNLCNLYLKHDERNFHCWDYRRFVTKNAQISAEEEFTFTTNKIKENFSNYSSWHYRSKLLPKIHPYSSDHHEQIEEKALLQEFEFVQNAFFTDPNDQSAWFYHRWLLGRAKQDLGLLLSYMRCFKDQATLYLLFNQQIKGDKLSSVVLTSNGEIVKSRWFNLMNSSHPSKIWITTFDCKSENTNLSIVCEIPNISIKLNINKDKTESWQIFPEQFQYIFKSELTAVHNKFLQNELESCQMLLEEEPDNKWTILTTVFLMRAVNPSKYSKDVAEQLTNLRKIDSYRSGYYADLDSKYKIENVIEKYIKGSEENESEKRSSIDLSNMNLSCLYHMEHMLLLREVNLSNNSLTNLDGCVMLQCCEILIVDNNHITTITKRGVFNLPCLKILSLKNNDISDISGLQALQTCRNLEKLNVEENLITEISEWKIQVKDLCPSLRELNRVDV